MVNETAPVLGLVGDLIFGSRISAAGRAAGVGVKLLREPGALAGVGGRMLLVDLSVSGAIEAASQWKAEQGGPVIGFVSHVDTDTIGRAQSAGFDQVLPRSRFVQVLPDLLARR